MANVDRALSKLQFEHETALEKAGAVQNNGEADKGQTEEDETKKKASSSLSYIPAQYITQLREKTVELYNERKKRKKQSNPFIHFADAEKISTFELSFNSNVSKSPVSGVDYEEKEDNLLLVTALGEKSIQIFNKNFNKIESTLKLDHNLIDCLFTPALETEDDVLEALASDDQGWIYFLSYNKNTHQFKVEHKENIREAVKCLTIHPLGSLLVALKGENEWILYDLKNRKLLYTGYAKASTSLAVHPDGHIIAITDSAGVIHFIDLAENEEVVTFESELVSD